MKVGNSLAVTLPRDAVADLGLAEGDQVDVAVVEHRIVIGPRRDPAALFASWSAIGAAVDPSAIVRAIREDRETR